MILSCSDLAGTISQFILRSSYYHFDYGCTSANAGFHYCAVRRAAKRRPLAALREASMHFENQSAVHKTLRRIACELDELGIAYAVAGDMAMFLNGYRKFTEIVEILFTFQGVRTLHQALARKGYIPCSDAGFDLREPDHGVRIHFLITPPEFGAQLNPLVQGKYWELCMDVQNDHCRGMY